MTKLANFQSFGKAAFQSLNTAPQPTSNTSTSARRPIGFRQRYQNQVEHVSNPAPEPEPELPRRFKNPYWDAILKITHEFIQAETKGHGNSFLQLKSKYAAACELYEQEKRDLPRQITDFKSKFMEAITNREDNLVSQHSSACNISNQNAENRRITINHLNDMSDEELKEGFWLEMNAKNKAYSFILESGLFDAFSSYCEKHERRVR